MTNNPSEDAQRQAAKFQREADQPRVGLVVEFVDFLLHNKKWWLIPILVVLALLGLLVILSATPLAPFIYPAI